MPGVLVADGTGLGKTFTSVAAAMICKLLTAKYILGWPLSILWGNAHAEWVNMAQNNYLGIISKDWMWDPLGRLNSVSHRISEIQTTPAVGHLVVTSAHKAIHLVTMSGLVEIFKNVIDEMTCGTGLKCVNWLDGENANLTHEDLDTIIDEIDNRWNIHVVLQNTITSTANPSGNGQLLYSSWSFGNCDESYWYKMKNTVGRQKSMNKRIAFKIQVTAMPGFHSLYDWCYQAMWLFSGEPEDREDHTMMEQLGAEVRNSTMMSLMHAIRTDNKYVLKNSVHRKRQISKHWTNRRWLESPLATEQPLVRLLKENAHLIDLKWSAVEQTTLKMLVQRYTSQGGSGAWRVHIWWPPCVLLVLGDTEHHNNLSGQWYDEWPINTWVDCPMFQWLREILMPILINESVEYREPEQEEASSEALLHEHGRNGDELPGTPHSQQVVLIYPLPGEVHHLQWWLTMDCPIIWISSTCMRKWVMMNAHKHSSNSRIYDIL